MITNELLKNLNKKNNSIVSKQDIPKNFLSKILLIDFRNFVRDSWIEFHSPVSAIVGRNGTGKTTLLHLAGCAYAPPNGRGKTYNDFIIQTERDELKYGTHYGFEYGDEKQHSFLWHIREEGPRVGVPTWDQRKSKTRRRKNILFFGAEKNITNYLLYKSFYNIKGADFNARISAIGTGDVQELQKQVVDNISFVLDKEYSSIFRRIDKYSNVFESSYGYHVNGQYSDLACGAGEIAVIRMLDMISSANDSLIVIDEPENGVHQGSQEKLLKFFLENALEKNNQYIFTTHSETLLRNLPADSIVRLQRREEGIRGVHANSSLAIKEITDYPEPKIKAIVEDTFAAKVLKSIIDNNPRINSQIDILIGDLQGFNGFPDIMKSCFPSEFYLWRYKSSEYATRLQPVLVSDSDIVFDLITLDSEFGSKYKVESYINEKNFDALNTRICRYLGGKGENRFNSINFKAILKHHKKNYTFQDLCNFITEFVNYSQTHIITLPGNKAPECVIYEWLKNELLQDTDVAKAIMDSIKRDERNEFRVAFTKALPQSTKDASNFAKERLQHKLKELAAHENLIDNVIYYWTNSNASEVDALVSKFTGLLE